MGHPTKRRSASRRKRFQAAEVVGPILSRVDEPFPPQVIELLSMLPVAHQEEVIDDKEPAQKRARLDEPPEHIVIVRDELLIKRPYRLQAERSQPAPSLPTLSFKRHDIGRFLKVHSIEENDGSEAFLSFSSGGRSQYGSYALQLSVDQSVFTQSLKTILEVMRSSPESRYNQGRLWVKADADFERGDGEDHLWLRFELSWNQSTNLFKSFPNTAQRKLSDLVQWTFQPFFTNLSGEEQIDQPVADDAEHYTLAPKDFYKAAHAPGQAHTELSTLSIPGLTANLYPFQLRSLSWLLGREGVRWTSNNSDGSTGLEALPAGPPKCLPLSFKEVEDISGRGNFYHSDLFHVVTRDIGPFYDLESLKGGILAEEMGLGKTVETISLILTHRRPAHPSLLTDPFTGRQVRPTGATLIVTPETLKSQWHSEFSRHSPMLRVMIYNGRKGYIGDEDDLVKDMAEHDVVITTYNVLQTEIHFAKTPPERSMRHERKHPRPTSPLVQLSWWRVCLDEAQEIESGVSAAAQHARLIPRVNAWGITGTPVKDSIKDLWGLLVFLRYEPFASYPMIWDTLMFVPHHHDVFMALFGRIALRNTKQSVRHELSLPPQKRYVITMPFTAIEEQNYQTKFKALAQSCGLNEDGTVGSEVGKRSSEQRLELMRGILAEIRQTVLHPELGPGRWNRFVAARKNKPLRTIEEVLDAMIEETESTIRSRQRSFLEAKLRRGQLFENSPRVKEALAIWNEVLEETEPILTECRKQLSDEIEKAERADSKDVDEDSDYGSDVDDDSAENSISPRVGDARRKLRLVLELKQKTIFFIASAYFQIRTNKDLGPPVDSDLFKELETLEVDNYRMANLLRKEILHESFGKASSYMHRIQKKAASQSFVEIPEFKSIDHRGIESRQVLETLEQLGAVLDEQADLIDTWREDVIQLLLQSLDGEGDEEITGEEMEGSRTVQDEVMAYTQVLRAVVADRQDALTGLANDRIKQELKLAERMAKNGEGPAPAKLLQLLELRNQNKPTQMQGSLRGVVTGLRELSTKLRHELANGSNRARVELEIVQQQLDLTQAQIGEHSKAATALEKEVDLFTGAMNARIGYYRQLQAISDSVEPWERGEDEDDEVILEKLLADEKKLQDRIKASSSAHRYQLHLKQQGQSSSGPKDCLICGDQYTLGALTECLHEFCRKCITLWVKAHKNCPTCKSKVTLASLQDVHLRKPELKLHTEQQPSSSKDSNLPHKPRKSGIYLEFGEEKLRAINDIQLNGPSFATKVDTMIRHLLWLRQADPGAKSIIFSQFGGFLNILTRAFTRYQIGFTSFDSKDGKKGKNGIARFREDPGIECFLMDARSHASGLNLVNASHVILCEPLLNTALELQAIARVDRIGQEHETTVWLYLVEGTVEESIYNLSVKRRIEHMGNNAKGKSKEMSTEEVSAMNLEVANSMELQQASLSKLMDRDRQMGEAVDKNDLWECLFGHVAREREAQQQAMDNDERFQNPAVMGFLAARAAEERRSIAAHLENERQAAEAQVEEGRRAADTQMEGDEE